MPQTYAQKYREDPTAFFPAGMVQHGEMMYPRYAEQNPPYHFLPPSRENMVAAGYNDRYYETRSGKGLPKGKGQYHTKPEPHYSASAYSGSTGATWDDVAPSSSKDHTSQGSISLGQTAPWEETADDPDICEESRAPPPFKVSGTSDVRIVAGAIASAARRGRRGLLISACGAASINQSVKSIAVARAYLKDDNIEIDVCGVSLADAQEFKHLVYMDIFFVRTRMREPLRQKTTHKVSGSSVAGKVAGAIASSLREGESCQVSVVGADAMLKAVLAVAICTKYMAIDPYPPHLVFWPDFDTIYVDGERRSGVSLYVIPTRKR